MYLRILKKDLKRKKTMNVILLLFVILSVMFASSSVNNILSVVNGLDFYFEKAGMGDHVYFAYTDEAEKIKSILDKRTDIDRYESEKVVCASNENFLKDGKKYIDFTRAGIIQSIDNTSISFFNADNEIVNQVEKGKVYITGSHPEKDGLSVGEKFTISIGSYEKEFEYAGNLKDALFGSDMMGNPRFLMNEEDFKELCSDEAVTQYYSANLITVYSESKADLSETADISGIIFEGDKDLIRTTYVMNTIVAAIILVVGIGLIIVSFVILRFTIGFTISEEFHEIGVMKAVGLKNGSIRAIYLVKYLGISLIGAVIGCIAGIPFGNLLLSSVSSQMYLGNENSTLVSILCSIAVVLIILSFCWSSTRKIKKLSPVDAVRSGQTGERFSRKSVLRLGRSRLGSTAFLSLNDVLSEPRQYGIITAVFTICMLLVAILANTANTLDSSKSLALLAVTESDAYLTDSSRAMSILAGEKSIQQAEDEIAQILEENNMPADIHLEAWYKLPVSFGDEKVSVTFLKNSRTKTTDYSYTDGTAPQYEDEIAITKKISEQLGGAEIGDKVKVNIDGEDREFLITAFFECFNNLGECARFHQDTEIPDSLVTSTFSFQIDFTDNPDAETSADRIEKIKDIFKTEAVFDARGFVNDCTGVSSTIKSVKNLVLILNLIIIIMISVLMERSFITKEKSEIALMKALGFNNRSVIFHHVSRFAILIAAAAVISAAFSTPLTNLLVDPLFRIMGTETRISYEIKPLEVFLIYPAIMLAAAIAGAWFTSLYTNRIKASDTANIE